MKKMPMGDYFSKISLEYLMLPVICVGIATIGCSAVTGMSRNSPKLKVSLRSNRSTKEWIRASMRLEVYRV
jgi:hypothetical protein